MSDREIMNSKSGINEPIVEHDGMRYNPEKPEETLDFISAPLNMSGQEWIDFIDSLTQEQKIQLSRCWD